MSETEDILIRIPRLLEHLKIRPTCTVLNMIYIILKNHGYKNIPTIQYSESENYITKKIINTYCNDIENIIKNKPVIEDQKKKTSKEVYMFQESNMLPQNVYVSEKGEEEKLEENYLDDDVTDTSESENSVNSEIEEQEEGYEIYDDDDSGDFSE